MTRKEAWNRIDVIITKNEVDDEYVTITNGKDYDALRYARKVLEQEPKTGHWILTSDDDCEYCTCSECGYQNGENCMIGSVIKFCQECGAKMAEPQERSE